MKKRRRWRHVIDFFMTGSSLFQYLVDSGVSGELHNVFLSVSRASERIGQAILTADIGKAGTTNVYGEEQLALDVLSDRIVQEELRKTPEVGLIASEELDHEVKIGSGPFAVAYDPLDGSSLVNVNLSVGSIFGIYQRSTFIGAKGDEQLASLFVVYGPRTTMMLTVKNGVKEFTLKQNGEWILTNDAISVAESGKMFAPGNLRATKYREDYVQLMEYWMREQYTLRYSGGMVPDINQILIKGKGIFTYPGYPDAPDGKLRLLFECAPMALLMEQAGGSATDGTIRILEKALTELSKRTPI
ncbi:fructose-1,6-bisphosphatase, partial [Candidatus Peregrinibacteria bacterium]|nr:fructose-1,6-bisphosphatase [Candidatus Peregrinibacteria bacterium]